MSIETLIRELAAIDCQFAMELEISPTNALSRVTGLLQGHRSGRIVSALAVDTRVRDVYTALSSPRTLDPARVLAEYASVLTAIVAARKE